MYSGIIGVHNWSTAAAVTSTKATTQAVGRNRASAQGSFQFSRRFTLQSRFPIITPFTTVFSVKKERERERGEESKESGKSWKKTRKKSRFHRLRFMKASHSFPIVFSLFLSLSHTCSFSSAVARGSQEGCCCSM